MSSDLICLVKSRLRNCRSALLCSSRSKAPTPPFRYCSPLMTHRGAWLFSVAGTLTSTVKISGHHFGDVLHASGGARRRQEVTTGVSLGDTLLQADPPHQWNLYRIYYSLVHSSSPFMLHSRTLRFTHWHHLVVQDVVMIVNVVVRPQWRERERWQFQQTDGPSALQQPWQRDFTTPMKRNP